MTQHERIESYMRENGSITPMEAFTNVGCTKLATRIGEMIQAGVPIRKEMQVCQLKNGATVRFMKYFLGGTQNEMDQTVN